MKRGVLIFVMPGCPACTHYAPRFQKLAAPYRARGLPVGIIDVTTPQGTRMGNHFRVNATPTTVVIRDGKQSRRIGAVSDKEIAQLLARAVT